MMEPSVHEGILNNEQLLYGIANDDDEYEDGDILHGSSSNNNERQSQLVMNELL